MSKWRNYGLWVAVASLLGMFLGNYGLYEQLGMTAEFYQQITDAILFILATAGIISNPEKGKWFKDKE